MAEHGWPKTDGDIDFASEGNSEVGGVVTVEAGEGITAGNVVYIHKTDGKAYVSDTGTADDIRADGIAHNTVLVGADVTVRVSGVYYSLAAFTDKEDYYLGASGAVSTTAGAVRIGTAISANELWVNVIQDDRDALGTIKAWLKNHANQVANPMTAFWKECDGTAISDAESPLNGGSAPDLNANVLNAKFLRGAATSDTGADNTADETDTHTHTMGDASIWAIPRGTGAVNSTSSAHTHTVNANGNVPPHIDVVFIMKIK